MGFFPPPLLFSFGGEFNFIAFNKPDVPIQVCRSGKELNQNNTETHSWQAKGTINWSNLGRIQDQKTKDKSKIPFNLLGLGF